MAIATATRKPDSKPRLNLLLTTCKTPLNDKANNSSDETTPHNPQELREIRVETVLAGLQVIQVGLDLD